MNLFRAPMALAAALFLTALVTRCTKSDPFGKELFDDPSGLTYTDTLTIKTSIVREDSTNTSIAGNQLLGQFDDPVFGRTDATINTNFWPGLLGYKFTDGSVVDSVVVYLNYDAVHFYGDTTQLQSLEIWRTNEVIAPDSSYYSKAVTTPAVKLGERLDFRPAPNVKYKQRDTSGITTQVDTFGAYIRIPIDKAIGQEILELDSANLASTKAFTDAMRGLRIVSTKPSGCMMSFNLNRTSFSRMTIFFKKPGEGLTRTFHCFFTANKWTTLSHDYTGKDVANLIGQETTGDLFVQAAAGLKVKIDIPHIKSLAGAAVNQAELELSLVEPALPGDDLTLHPPVSQALLSYYSEFDEKYLYTADVYAAAGSGLTGSFQLFGGSKKKEADGVSRYRLNLSDHLQDMISGKLPSTLFVNVYPQNLSVQRAVFHGAGGAAGLRAKVNVKYSKI